MIVLVLLAGSLIRSVQPLRVRRTDPPELNVNALINNSWLRESPCTHRDTAIMALSTPQRPPPEWEEEAQPLAALSARAETSSSNKKAPSSPLVRRLERSLATLESYNSRPPPVLSLTQQHQTSGAESRRLVGSPRASPRPASAPTHRDAPSRSLPSQYSPILTGANARLVEAMVFRAEHKLGAHPLIDARTGRPLRTPRLKRSALGPPPPFVGQPTYVRTTGIPGSRRPPPPGSAELRKRRESHVAAPYDFEHSVGGAYIRRRSERPKLAKDSPRLVGEIDSQVSERLGSTIFSPAAMMSDAACSAGGGLSARGRAQAANMRPAPTAKATGDGAASDAAAATSEQGRSRRTQAAGRFTWDMLPSEVHEQARAVSAAMDATVMSDDVSSEPYVLVMGVSEHACGHTAYLLKAPDDPDPGLAVSAAEVTLPLPATPPLESDAAPSPSPAVESVRLKKRMAAIERKVHADVGAVCKYSSKIDDRAWLERWMAVDPER